MSCKNLNSMIKDVDYFDYKEFVYETSIDGRGYYLYDIRNGNKKFIGDLESAENYILTKIETSEY